jgi:divalent metal cation (Fe/Co/Zn/Cd) transporter
MISAPPPQRAFGRLWRALKQLFHEVVGAVFAVLAIAWLNSLLRAWTRDAAHWLMALAGCVVALFVFFAVTSFRKARKL